MRHTYSYYKYTSRYHCCCCAWYIRIGFSRKPRGDNNVVLHLAFRPGTEFYSRMVQNYPNICIESVFLRTSRAVLPRYWYTRYVMVGYQILVTGMYVPGTRYLVPNSRAPSTSTHSAKCDVLLGCCAAETRSQNGIRTNSLMMCPASMQYAKCQQPTCQHATDPE